MANRNLITPNDFGPAAVPRARLSRNGLGARLIYKSNPLSFFTDWLGPCLPFFSLQGGQDTASQEARAGLLGEGGASSYSVPGSATGAATTGTKPATNTPVASNPSTPSGGSSSGGDRGGIFNTIRAVDAKP
jgi:hypothetical protein